MAVCPHSHILHYRPRNANLKDKNDESIMTHYCITYVIMTELSLTNKQSNMQQTERKSVLKFHYKLHSCSLLTITEFETRSFLQYVFRLYCLAREVSCFHFIEYEQQKTQNSSTTSTAVKIQYRDNYSYIF
jgi:hypothetical protein